MTLDLSTFVTHFAEGIQLADQRRPNLNPRYQPGVGPHHETDTVKLVLRELELLHRSLYVDRYAVEVPYPDNPRLKCDLCLGTPGNWDWAIEVKMMRLYRDNGTTEDSSLNKLLSPYPQHHSALTDCDKLCGSNLGLRQAILIYGYDYDDYPLEPMIESFEALAHLRAKLSPPWQATFAGLIHPTHRRGSVFAWELAATST
jgi:hypothetical protein